MIAIFLLTFYLFVIDGFDIIHTAQPPDTFVFIVAFYKLFGKLYVMDHHDLAPELYYSHFKGNGSKTIYKMLTWLEGLSFRFADQVISTNEFIKKLLFSADMLKNLKSQLYGMVLNLLTEIIGVKSGIGSSYGDYKDKAIDVKYQFWREGKYTPAFAVGIMDPTGNRLYTGQYLVASKQIYPFDFTLGFGNGRFGKRPLVTSPTDKFGAEIVTSPREMGEGCPTLLGDSVFPFREILPHDGVRPDQIQRADERSRSGRVFHQAGPSAVQFRLSMETGKVDGNRSDLPAGQRDRLNFSMLFDIGQPLIPLYDKPYKEKPRVSAMTAFERIAVALREQGLSDVGIDEAEGVLSIRAQNDKYFYSMKAVGVIMKTIMPLMTPSTEEVRITLTQTGLPIFRVETTAADIRDLYAGRLTSGEFFRLSRITTDIDKAPDIPTTGNKLLTPGWRPSFETLLNDPSGYFKYRLGLEGWLAYHPWQGASLVGSLQTYPLNNISTSNIPPSEAVRSDIFAYKKRDVGLDRLMFDQVCKPTGNAYARFAAGLLEIEYAGIDSEVAMPLANGRFLVGVQASLVKKRDPGTVFALKAYDVKKYYDVEFFNARLNIPEKEMAIDVKVGRFLGGDFGARVTLIKYIKGVTLFAWYSITDTAVFHDPNNRGYHDKGIGVIIPIRLFEGEDSRSAYNYALSPWMRDVAQDINRYQNLFDVIGRDTKVFLQKEGGMVDW